MNHFHQLEGEQVILRSGGVFKQVDLFERDDILFAKHGSGYVRLLDKGQTSHPKTFWDEMSVRHKIVTHGYLKQTMGLE